MYHRPHGRRRIVGRSSTREEISKIFSWNYGICKFIYFWASGGPSTGWLLRILVESVFTLGFESLFHVPCQCIFLTSGRGSKLQVPLPQPERSVRGTHGTPIFDLYSTRVFVSVDSSVIPQFTLHNLPYPSDDMFASKVGGIGGDVRGLQEGRHTSYLRWNKHAGAIQEKLQGVFFFIPRPVPPRSLADAIQIVFVLSCRPGRKCGFCLLYKNMTPVPSSSLLSFTVCCVCHRRFFFFFWVWGLNCCFFCALFICVSVYWQVFRNLKDSAIKQYTDIFKIDLPSLQVFFCMFNFLIFLIFFNYWHENKALALNIGLPLLLPYLPPSFVPSCVRWWIG